MFDSILGVGLGVAFILAIFLVASVDVGREKTKTKDDID